MNSYFKKINWWNLAILTLLLLFEISIHPLTYGPDRRIHDPAVYRLQNPNYLPGDWYTGMAVESGVYTFYAKLVGAWRLFSMSEEAWRLFMYILGLVVLYCSMLKIAKILSQNRLVIPFVAAFHALVVTSAPPVWLYGLFIQIDGGLAPRTVGIALSFLALVFLLKNSRILPWFFLGIATLIHVSNSFIIFTLFLGAWLWYELFLGSSSKKLYWRDLVHKFFIAAGVYIAAGGWFALYVASPGSNGVSLFAADKFIWTWIYLRAPYMALPFVSWVAWLLFLLHVLAIGIGWYLLLKKGEIKNRRAINLMGLIGLAAIAYFFVFYLFTFVWPWIPGFLFYSIRVVYFAYFVAYVFAALLLLSFYKTWFLRNSIEVRILFSSIIIISAVCYPLFSIPGKKFLKQVPINLRASWDRVSDNTIEAPQLATEKILALKTEPFLGPPNWYGSSYYLPSVVTFKSFGFTQNGLGQWFERMNDVSRGEVKNIYESQKKAGQWKPVLINWRKEYSKLTAAEVVSLASKYRFQLFLTYKDLSYPFQLISEDDEFRLYYISARN